MEIYHFSSPSLLSKVEFTQDAKHIWMARIFANPGVPPEKLAALTTVLNERRDGIIATPQSDKNVHTLYASGFTSPQGLLTQLQNLQYTAGKPKLEKTSLESDTFANSIRSASLQWAGVAYLLSDAALIGSGLKSGRYKESIAGGLYASVGLVLAKYGKKDSHTYVKDLSLKLGDFFTQSNIAIPKDGAIMGANNERHSPIVEGLERFAYSYPSQIFNAVVAVCGYKLLQSGIEHKKSWDTAAGSLVLGGALAGLLIPEKKDRLTLLRPGEEEKKAPTSALGRAYAWAQDRPLRVPGMLWFGNNVAFLISALKERKNNPEQKSYIFKMSYVAAAVIANGLMFISTKQENKRFGLSSEATQAVMSVAANVISQQPPEQQEHIIEQVAGLMVAEGTLTCPAKDIANCLREQIRELKQNPFASPSTRFPQNAIASAAMESGTRNVTASRARPKADWRSGLAEEPTETVRSPG